MALTIARPDAFAGSNAAAVAVAGASVASLAVAPALVTSISAPCSEKEHDHDSTPNCFEEHADDMMCHSIVASL